MTRAAEARMIADLVSSLTQYFVSVVNYPSGTTQVRLVKRYICILKLLHRNTRIEMCAQRRVCFCIVLVAPRIDYVQLLTLPS